MKCSEVRNTDICKLCEVVDLHSDCPTTGNEGSSIKYTIPPHTIFDLVPYKNHVGEQVICVEENTNSSDNIKVGEIFTVIDQTNEHFGYIRLDRFKDFPLVWFGPGNFKKLKAKYNNVEYSLVVHP